MKKWHWRGRMLGLALVSGTLMQLSGCLSDRQLSQIIESVLTTGLSTLVSQAVAAVAGAAGGA